MQSKGAKIIFILLVVIAGAGFWWYNALGPGAETKAVFRELYRNYKRTEATIVSQESNGRIGKSAHQIWTVQYADDKGELHTGTMQQNTLMPRNNGEKLTIYYDPTGKNAFITEENYKDAME